MLELHHNLSPMHLRLIIKNHEWIKIIQRLGWLS